MEISLMCQGEIVNDVISSHEPFLDKKSTSYYIPAIKERIFIRKEKK